MIKKIMYVIPDTISSTDFSYAFNSLFKKHKNEAHIVAEELLKDKTKLILDVINYYNPQLEYENDYESLKEKYILDFFYIKKSKYEHPFTMPGYTIITGEIIENDLKDTDFTLKDILDFLAKSLGGYLIYDTNFLEEYLFFPSTDILGPEYQQNSNSNILKQSLLHILDKTDLTIESKINILEQSLNLCCQELENRNKHLLHDRTY